MICGGWTALMKWVQRERGSKIPTNLRSLLIEGPIRKMNRYSHSKEYLQPAQPPRIWRCLVYVAGWGWVLLSLSPLGSSSSVSRPLDIYSLALCPSLPVSLSLSRHNRTLCYLKSCASNEVRNAMQHGGNYKKTSFQSWIRLHLIYIFICSSKFIHASASVSSTKSMKTISISRFCNSLIKGRDFQVLMLFAVWGSFTQAYAKCK